MANIIRFFGQFKTNAFIEENKLKASVAEALIKTPLDLKCFDIDMKPLIITAYYVDANDVINQTGTEAVEKCIAVSLKEKLHAMPIYYEISYNKITDWQEDHPLTYPCEEELCQEYLSFGQKLTPEIFEAQMQNIKVKYEDDPDPENVSFAVQRLINNVLTTLGYGKGLAIANTIDMEE